MLFIQLHKTQNADGKRWRVDGKCGGSYPLRDESPSECDPSGDSPCCNEEVQSCGNTRDFCKCSRCIDYRTESKCEILEVRGFLKNVCTDKSSGEHHRCLHSDVTYKAELDSWDQSSGVLLLSNVTAECENDPHVYQACGFNTHITDNALLCGGFFCRDGAENTYKYTEYSKKRLCNESSDVKLLKSDLEVEQNCDGECDIPNTCADEGECNGLTYGMQCKRSNIKSYIPVHWVCNEKLGCADGEDEMGCHSYNDSDTKECLHYYGNKILGKNITVPIMNNTRCATFDIFKGIYPYCLDFMDQTNCTDEKRNGGQCEVSKLLTNISSSMVCSNFKFGVALSDNFSLCDDNIENQCIYPSDSTDCLVHRHKMCDEVKDCEDESDEHHDDCILKTEDHFVCKRRFGDGRELSLPLSWTIDGIKDCINGQDENPKTWTSCRSEKENITWHIYKNDEECSDVFLCMNKKTPYVRLQTLCDGVESCKQGLENELCRFSRDFPDIERIPSINDKVADICTITGWELKHCEQKEFIGPAGKTFGVSKFIAVPRNKVDCDHLFGEFYVYLSCMDLCLHSTCPLPSTPLKYNSCPGQYSDRIYSLANKRTLTFVTKANAQEYETNHFQCKNKQCVEYSKVCDLVNDCGDMSDEKNCTNHIKCFKANNSIDNLISLKQQCDGMIDCFDLSDECNEECGKQILGHWLLKVICWMMGLCAILFNVVQLIQLAISFKSVETGSLLQTKVLVALISLGDLLNGVYLIILSVYDSFVFGEDYCKKQMEWLSGGTCAFLGIISTMGSQLSLFAMTALSLTRVIGLTFMSMRAPSGVSKKVIIRIIAIVTTIVALSASVALVPFAESLEDYFVQGLYYNKTNKLFIGLPNKERHIRVLRIYESSANISKDISWRDINKKVNRMFTQQYDTISRKKIHFYGNDGVCLFKFFVRSDDARRSRQTLETKTEVLDIINFEGNLMLWIMLSINFICFIIMTVSYILITIQTWKSSSESGQNQNPGNYRKNKKIQLRVSLIIATDFLCWIPFIFVCALHNLQLIDATDWYAYFAMIVLPMNSVINPLLYDNTITNWVASSFRRLISIP